MKKINEVKKEIKRYDDLIGEAEEDLKNAEYELSKLIEHREELENDIKNIIKKTEEKKEEDERRRNFILTSNGFESSLSKASLFCPIGNDALSTIKLYKDKIVATSGYIGIIIDEIIPEKNQNTEISWDLKSRDNKLKGNHLEMLNNVYNSGMSNFKKQVTVKKVDIFKKLNVEKKEISKELVYVFSYDDVELAIDVRYLEDALLVFEDEDEILFTFPKTRIGALLLENNSQKLILMPIRLS